MTPRLLIHSRPSTPLEAKFSMPFCALPSMPRHRYRKRTSLFKLKDGRIIAERADGARGYPGRLTDDELNTKFLACARRSLPDGAAVQVLAGLRAIETISNIGELMQLCSVSARENFPSQLSLM